MSRYYIVGDNGVRVYRTSEAAGRELAQSVSNRTGRVVPLFEDRTGLGFGGTRRGLAKPPGSGRVTGSREDTYTRNPVPKPSSLAGYTVWRESRGKWVPYAHTETRDGAKFYAEQVRGSATKIIKNKPMVRNPIDFSPPEYASFKDRGDARAAQVSRAQKPARLAAHARRGWLGKAPTPKAAANSNGQKFVVHAVGRKDSYRITRSSEAAAEKIAEQYEAAGYKVTVARANPAPKTKAAKARKSAAHKRGAYVEWRNAGKVERLKCGNKGIATIRANELKRSGYAGVRVIGA